MASVRQVDTALWLHNKLSSDDPWSGSSLRSLLTPDVLRNIPECFHRLETQVKVKFLTAFLHIPRRVLDETSIELGEILEIGSQDEDEWVRVLCEVLKYYPNTGMLNVHLEEASPVFGEVCREIRNVLAHSDSSSLLPLECPYLNRTALQALVGQQPALPKHFTLRRKPKSAALRAELAAKANEAMAAQKKAGSAASHKPQSPAKKFEAPVRITPRAGSSHGFLHPPSGRPSTSGSSGSRSIISAATLKQHGRTKLLDINEQPIGGGREVKRRKLKMQDTDQAEDAKQKKTDTSKSQEPSTPKYAAGLTPMISQAKPSTSPDTLSTSASAAPPTPSYAVLSGAAPVTTSQSNNPGAQTSAGAEPSLSESTINLKRELEMHMEQQRQLMFRERQQKQAAAAAMANLSTASSSASSSLPTNTPAASRANQPAAGTSAASASAGSTSSPATMTASQQQQKKQQQQQQQQQEQQQQDNKRQLSLSREQMLAAHEMFRNANRVSRTEKALILGFMAGARDKPFNHQGPIITIKLSENTETSQAADGGQQTLLVEMLFEMNYDTGHWRRLKRTRVLSKQTGSTQD